MSTVIGGHMRSSFVIVVASCAMACSTSGVMDDVCEAPEQPLSQVADPPTEEAEVTERVPAERQFVVAWSMTRTDLQDKVTVTMTRGSAEATVAEPGAACPPGWFLRVPYDVSVTVGEQDAVGHGAMSVRADDADPPNLYLEASPSMTTALSQEWEAAAEDALDPRYVEWEWFLYYGGPLESPRVSLKVDFETADAHGWEVLWRGEMVSP